MIFPGHFLLPSNRIAIEKLKIFEHLPRRFSFDNHVRQDLGKNRTEYSADSNILPSRLHPVGSLFGTVDAPLAYRLHHFYQKGPVRVADFHLRTIEEAPPVCRISNLRQKHGTFAVYRCGEPTSFSRGHHPTIGRSTSSSPILPALRLLQHSRKQFIWDILSFLVRLLDGKVQRIRFS